jgi:DNA-directed RNA polymerase subunit RPC12/RpoP
MVEYVCERCGRILTEEDLKAVSSETTIYYMCRYCNHRVLYKPRRPIAKVVKAI